MVVACAAYSRRRNSRSMRCRADPGRTAPTRATPGRPVVGRARLFRGALSAVRGLDGAGVAHLGDAARPPGPHSPRAVATSPAHRAGPRGCDGRRAQRV